jgi:hypothetical protein
MIYYTIDLFVAFLVNLVVYQNDLGLDRVFKIN